MGKSVITVLDVLDEMAASILMVEPGDLSMVGELLELTEQLSEDEIDESLCVIGQMADIFKNVLGKIIMAELDDSVDNYERLGQCLVQMQEVVRKGGEVDEVIAKKFFDHIRATGFTVDDKVVAAIRTGDESAALSEVPLASGAAAPVQETVDKEIMTDIVTPPKAPVSLDFLEDRELLSGFIDEALEHLELIEVNVLDLEHNPDDLNIINNIFRPFHTIKGVSGFLNLKTINKLAHTTENLLDDVRNNVRTMDSDIIDIVLNVGDCLKGMVENIKDALEKGPEYYVETDITEYIHTIEQLQKGEALVQPVPSSTVASAAAKIGQIDKVSSTGGVQPQEVAQGQPAVANRKLGFSIKVEVEKLDALVNAVGELVIMQSLVRQNPLVAGIADPKLTKDFSQLSRITSDLQKTAMSMRMVPIRQTFDKMTRLVRDLARKSGKQVNLVMAGAETEIDRNMVDSIYDPLVHMMRNSVDHGVSTPEERKKIGKSATGTIKLSAYQKGGNIVIEIEDDGEGINTAKIRQKAIERDLIKEEANRSDYELNNMIFLPGFSTADQITDVSGRGVGMDVVKGAVEKLRGKVDVSSCPGKGSQFLIRLPLTLAIIDGIIVRVGEERYIIPTVAIQESMRPEKKNYNTVHGKGETLLIRDNLVPIIRLYKMFGVQPTYADPCDAIVVVIENEGRRRALMVDELLGKEEVVIKSLGGYMKDIEGVAGGTILGDGRVGLIFDLAGLIATSER